MAGDDLCSTGRCNDCGEWVDPTLPWFRVRSEIAICYACAARRGGRFDSVAHEWVMPSDIITLHRFLEARPDW
jgi:hypothetical protein